MCCSRTSRNDFSTSAFVSSFISGSFFDVLKGFIASRRWSASVNIGGVADHLCSGIIRLSMLALFTSPRSPPSSVTTSCQPPVTLIPQCAAAAIPRRYASQRGLSVPRLADIEKATSDVLSCFTAPQDTDSSTAAEPATDRPPKRHRATRRMALNSTEEESSQDFQCAGRTTKPAGFHIRTENQAVLVPA